MSNIQINPYNFAAAVGVGGWVELGRTTLGSAGDTISVGSLPDKLYLMFLNIDKIHILLYQYTQYYQYHSYIY